MTIPYELYGVERSYSRINYCAPHVVHERGAGATVVLEIKGRLTEEDRAKQSREALNKWGKLGRLGLPVHQQPVLCSF